MLWLFALMMTHGTIQYHTDTPFGTQLEMEFPGHFSFRGKDPSCTDRGHGEALWHCATLLSFRRTIGAECIRRVIENDEKCKSSLHFCR